MAVLEHSVPKLTFRGYTVKQELVIDMDSILFFLIHIHYNADMKRSSMD